MELDDTINFESIIAVGIKKLKRKLNEWETDWTEIQLRDSIIETLMEKIPPKNGFDMKYGDKKYFRTYIFVYKRTCFS